MNKRPSRKDPFPVWFAKPTDKTQSQCEQHKLYSMAKEW